MAFQFNEKPNVRRTSVNPPTYETQYIATGISDQQTVRAYAAQATAYMVAVGDGILFRNDIVVQEMGPGVFSVTVSYVTQEQQKPAVGSLKFSFSTTGGTFHITHAREHVQSYVASGTAPLHYGAINVVRNGDDQDIQGADIVIPALKLTITFNHPRGIVNINHARTLAGMTGCVNSATFLGFAAGEVIFLGADGSDGTNADAEITYHFACESNLEGLTYQNGTITGVSKNGHDLLWLESSPSKDANNKPVVKVIAVHIERVYRRVDLKAALGFG